MKTAALDELDALTEALDDPAQAGLAEALQRVSDAAEGIMGSGAAFPPGYIPRMVELVRRVPGLEYPTQRTNALIAASYYTYLMGFPFEGVTYAVEAVAFARRTQHALLRRALTVQGVADADSGNVPRAIECYAEALDLARALKDPDSEATVWINLGVALLYAAQYRDALACFEHTIRLATTGGAMAKYLKTASANIALACIHLGEIERGLKAAESALRGLPEPTSDADLVSRVLREEYYARLLLEAGEVQAAGEHIALAVHYAEKSGSLRAQIAAAMTQGLHEIYAGRTEAGIALLTRTAERSRRDLPIMLRDVLTMLVKAYEFLGMPREALTHMHEMFDWLRRWHHENALEHVRLHLEPLPVEGGRDADFSTRLRKHEAQLRGKVVEQEMFRSPSEMLERLAVTAELRDDSTGEHCYRLGKLAALLARDAGSDAAACERIELAARLHDIGKNAIPDAIILKRGRLTDGERQIMRTHSAVGADLLANSNIPRMEMAEQVARHHHDWWDGSNGERRFGDEIPYAARLVALADMFDALTHERPHRSAWSIHEALDEITRLRGTQFDPRLTDLFVEMILRLRREHRDLDAFLGEAAKASRFLQARSRLKDVLKNAR